MAKSVSILLMVFAVAVFHEGVHRVSAVGSAAEAAEAAAALESLAKFKEGVEWTKRINDSGELIAKWVKAKKSESSNPLPAGLYHTMVTSITVGEETTGNGVAILSTSVPIAFLDKEAYGLIQGKLPNDYADSQLSAQQLCYARTTADQLPQVTLVFALNGADKTVSDLWYKQTTDGSWCLAILPST
ncbi:hypothetical protein ACQ4PT_020366 [Festuca glaucescens]